MSGQGIMLRDPSIFTQIITSTKKSVKNMMKKYVFWDTTASGNQY